ncbi:hypothetical protein Poly51_05700 [Rubripirellula tenax]|uniref:Matrixin n=1 Tax=Rubripirellula tenax TaxID=2528015 RepID=A0A5C6FHL2_9BACT|nr:zinc-dependent metalloprotease family protein [Rubripirellula tenax]TWU60295.1 hypothetical protein Poly51_05700 [Rubripirellula tenax]
MRWNAIFAALLLLTFVSSSHAALVIDPALPITRRVSVQPIIVSNDNGTNTSAYFGSASQQESIIGLIDSIWAQAGIDIEFFTPNFWNNTFANVGNGTSTTSRPTNDLGTIVNNGDTAGVGNADPNVIDMYFVEIAAGFSDTSENTANGLAFVGGNGITQHVGDNLPGFLGGREVVASVVAHEIGHNLGLPHITSVENLMQSGGSPNQGERLLASQITTARNSRFARTVTAVPETSSFAALFAIAGGIVVIRRRRNSSGL